MSYVPTSCVLFHGPGSEETGHRAATSYGRLLPFTGSSLKKDGARELVSLLSSRTMVSTSVLVGPIDEASPATSDVLLKVIEELDPRGVKPFLWAWDLGGVSVTLRSRCVLQFCPGVDVRTESYLPNAKSLLKAYSQGDWVTLIESVQGEDDVILLLCAVSEGLRRSSVSLGQRLVTFTFGRRCGLSSMVPRSLPLASCRPFCWPISGPSRGLNEAPRCVAGRGHGRSSSPCLRP